jgi:hypothetical protein
MLLVCTSPGLGYTKVQFVGRPIKQGRRVLLEPKRERILGMHLPKHYNKSL